MGNKVQYGFMVGKSLSGKTTLAKIMEKNHGYTLIDMKSITQDLKDNKVPEEGPYEGEIPLEEAEEAVLRIIKNGK